MLTRRNATLVTAVGVTTLVGLAASPSQAADKPGTGARPCGRFVCAGVQIPGSDSGRGGNGSTGAPETNTDTEGSAPPPCEYELADPQPPSGSELWEGHDPSEGGAVYLRTCGSLTTFVYGGPGGPPAVAVDPAVLAQQALDKMLLRGPEIGITPKPGGKGVVGMPVYLWTEKGPETYGPNVASASAGGITVTATAKVSRIVWNMGDGKTITCTTAGTPYKAAYGKKPSPDCGHRYSAPSSTTGSGKFHVTATSTWTIDWEATSGQTGQLTETRDSAVDITVAEVQVLN
ncbi:putative membrane protein [Streptomyces sp. V1I6]|nr:putative membrane protein [Streptomyces sp. V1I6]